MSHRHRSQDSFLLLNMIHAKGNGKHQSSNSKSSVSDNQLFPYPRIDTPGNSRLDFSGMEVQYIDMNMCRHPKHIEWGNQVFYICKYRSHHHNLISMNCKGSTTYLCICNHKKDTQTILCL